MKNVIYIMRRDLAAFFYTKMGSVIMAVVLAIDGLLFNAWAIGDTERRSSAVLEMFFFCTSGTTIVASILISMRLIAEERQTGTLTVLTTSAVKDWQLVFGKFLSALAFLALLTLLTAYMPALIFVHGKVSLGHIAAGYLGLMLLGSATIGLSLFASALAPNQLTAAMLGSALVVFFLSVWKLAHVASPPLESVLAYLAIHDKHFKPFMQGLISVADVVFYVSLTYLALLAATRVLEARRWG